MSAAIVERFWTGLGNADLRVASALIVLVAGYLAYWVLSRSLGAWA